MDSLLQFILDLFNNESSAQSFVADPNAALANAGLADVSPEQIQSVAASAIPGLELAGADPVSGLAQAVSNQFGFAPVDGLLSAPGAVAGVVADQALNVGLDGGSNLAAAVGDGIGVGLGQSLGAGFGAALGGGLETGVGLGTSADCTPSSSTRGMPTRRMSTGSGPFSGGSTTVRSG